MQNRLVPCPHVVVNNWDISAVKVPPEERGAPAPHQAPKPRVPVLGRQVPITLGCKNQCRLRLSKTEGLWSPRLFLLKSPGVDLL